RLTLTAGGLEQLDVAGVQQIEDAVGEDHRAALLAAPGNGLIQRPYLDGAAGTHAGLADRPNRALRAGGAMKVVTMTTRRTAPNVSLLSRPDRRPMSAKMRPTSP